jgi:hypothetical protein
MTRERVRVLLTAAWVATLLFLIYVAGVPVWLAFIGNLVGAVVIYNYARAFSIGSLSRGEKVLRIGAYIFLGTIAAFFVLLLVVTMLAFLVAWLAN